ncbi:hypothetical protein [Mycolicibacterium peregrinum]|uniref:hypothetical protein n=1 Tax=Mycolicibacterium peregrinum TaxID=43304 RepID=UPI003AAC41B5
MSTSNDYLAGRGAYPRDVRLRNLAAQHKSALAETADQMATVAIVLGDHLADIAEMVGLDRDTEDLAIPPNVKRVVDEHEQLSQTINEIRELAQHWRDELGRPPWPPAQKRAGESILAILARRGF